MEWQRRPPGGLLPGDPPRRDPRQGPRRPPGAGDARTRIAVGAGHGRRPSTWLKDLDPGRGGGLLEGRRVCARSGQQGRARGVLIVCCDGPAGLPEAARGDLARLHGPHLRGPPRSAPPVRFVAYGDRKGVAAALRPSLHRPRRGGRPTGPRRLPPVRPGPASTPRRRRRGRGPGRGSSPSWPSPRPCAGSPLHHQRDRVAQPPSRAVRREPRPLPLRRGGGRTAVAGGSATSRTAGPRSAPRRRTRPPTRAGPTGGLVEGQVTTNRSAPPAGPPGSPPPTPTESTPTSDRTRLHRNIDRLPGLSRYPATSLSAAGSASSWAEPMCSMLRDPHQEEECAICTAWAPDAVLTVRTYGLAPPRQCASPPTQPAQFQRESASGPPNAPQ